MDGGLLTIVLTIAIKFCASVTFFAVNLQALETYPTCLRQTGISMGIVAANAFGMFGPYIVYVVRATMNAHIYPPPPIYTLISTTLHSIATTQGKNVDSTYPYWILFGLFVLGTVCGLFTPETFRQKLPDSLADAMHFGEDQLFWSLPPAKKAVADAAEAETEELNPIKYAP